MPANGIGYIQLQEQSDAYTTERAPVVAKKGQLSSGKEVVFNCQETSTLKKVSAFVLFAVATLVIFATTASTGGIAAAVVLAAVGTAAVISDIRDKQIQSRPTVDSLFNKYLAPVQQGKNRNLLLTDLKKAVQKGHIKLEDIKPPTDEQLNRAGIPREAFNFVMVNAFFDVVNKPNASVETHNDHIQVVAKLVPSFEDFKAAARNRGDRSELFTTQYRVHFEGTYFERMQRRAHS